MEITSIDSFLSYYEGVRERTRRVVHRIPSDQLEWRYAPHRFSCGDLVRHLAATERYLFAENVCGKPSRYPGHGRELANGMAAVLDLFERLHREAVEIIGSLTDAQLQRRCLTPTGTQITAWKWLRAMVEHEVHHRGQIYMILGMLQVETPPLYGLTEPEVLDRSMPFTAE